MRSSASSSLRKSGKADTESLSHEHGIYPSCLDVVAPYLAELVGTFLITVTYACNPPTWGSGLGGLSDPVWSITSTAFMWTALIYAFRHVSGAQLNPSVTMGLLIAGRMTAQRALAFVFFQLIGAVGAMFAIYGMNQATERATAILGPHEGCSWFQVGLVEVLYSALTCFVYLSCAASVVNNPLKRQNGFIGYAVGFSVIAGGYACWEVSRAVLNTAIAISIAIVAASVGSSVMPAFYYILFDVLGALLGVGFFAAVRPREFRRSDLQVQAGTPPVGLSQAVLAEFIGTFYIILTKALSRLSPAADSLPDAWAVLAVVVCMSCSLRDISGGHFNPAVTLSAWSTRRSMALKNAVAAITIQIIAGVAAAAVSDMYRERIGLSKGQAHTVGTVGMAERSYSQESVMTAEFVFTFLVCYTVLATGLVPPVPLQKQPNNAAGIAYGAVQSMVEFSTKNLSSSSMNPAVVIAFEILCVRGGGDARPHWRVIGSEVAGAVFAAGCFFVTHAALYRKAAAEGAQNGTDSLTDCAADLESEKP